MDPLGFAWECDGEGHAAAWIPSGEVVGVPSDNAGSTRDTGKGVPDLMSQPSRELAEREEPLGALHVPNDFPHPGAFAGQDMGGLLILGILPAEPKR